MLWGDLVIPMDIAKILPINTPSYTKDFFDEKHLNIQAFIASTVYVIGTKNSSVIFWSSSKRRIAKGPFIIQLEHNVLCLFFQAFLSLLVDE